jgi:hypothetical protein
MALLPEFAGLEGAWSGTYKLWLGPHAPEASSATHATVRYIGDARFLVYDYDWSYEGERHEGSMMLGRDAEGAHHMAWADTFHTAEGVMFSTGEGAQVTVLTSYGPPDQQWGWRTEFRADGDQFVVTAFNITPDGTEIKATEASYTPA